MYKVKMYLLYKNKIEKEEVKNIYTFVNFLINFEIRGLVIEQYKNDVLHIVKEFAVASIKYIP